jgi:hypothetical protein
MLRAVLLWVGANVLFDKVFGLPRYRPVRSSPDAGQSASDNPADAAGSNKVTVEAVAPVVMADPTGATPDINSAAWLRSAVRPRFLDRLPESVDVAAVLAMRADQHYVHVVTPERTYMTLCRFSDAVAELPSDIGLQINRSNWVRNDQIEKICVGAGKMCVHLRSGQDLQVSGSYKALVRRMCTANGIPVVPRV